MSALSRERDETRVLLDHFLTFGTPVTRMVDARPKPVEATTDRVTCGYCGETWDGVGFIIEKCAVSSEEPT